MSVLLTLLALLSFQAPSSIETTGLGPVHDILAQPEYAFCHDEGYPLTEDEARWCPEIPAEGLPLCPALASACEAPRAVLRGEGRLSARSAAEPDEAAKEPEDDDDSKRRRGEGDGPRRAQAKDDRDDALELPVLGGFARVLFWGVIVAAVVLVAWAIFRNVARNDTLPLDQAAPDEPADEEAAARDAATLAMETDVSRLLQLARTAAQQGAFGEAVDFTHAALLRRLDHEGLIRLHASRTNGEYIRELRGNRALLEPVQDALRDIDRAQFGPQPATGGVFEAVFQRVTAIVKTVGPLVVLLATVFGSSAACDSEADTSYPWATSPSGTQAVLEFIRQDCDVEAGYRTAPLRDLDPENASFQPVLVMLGDTSASEEEWDAVRRWVANGGQLIVAGGEIPPWLDVRYGYSEEVFDAGGEVAYGEPFAVVPAVDAAGGRSVLLWVEDAIELDVGPTGDPYIAMFLEGAGSITVLADDHLFTNVGLAFGTNAWSLSALVASYERDVEFVDGWVGKGSDTPADAIAHTHLTAAVVQLLVLILALYLWRGVRFGRGRDPERQTRRAFAQHAVAMGRQYHKARAASFASGLFAAWVLERLRNRFSSSAAAGLHGLSQEVARVSGRDDTEVMRLLVAAHSATETHASPGGSGEDLALIRDLGRLMRDIGEST